MRHQCISATATQGPSWFEPDQCRVDDLKRVVQNTTQPDKCPMAASIVKNMPMSDCGAEHFAKPGENERVWSALKKVCLRATDLFAAY